MKYLFILLLSLALLSLIFINSHGIYRALKNLDSVVYEEVIKFHKILIYNSKEKLYALKNRREYLEKTMIEKIDSTNNTVYYSSEIKNKETR